MMTIMATSSTNDSTALVTIDNTAARRYRAASKSSSTQRSYRSAVADDPPDDSPNGRRRAAARKYPAWSTWAAAHGTSTLPAAPDAIAAYLAELADAGASVATIHQRRAAIAWTHRAANLPDPTNTETVRAVAHGIARTNTRPRRQSAPALVDDLDRMAAVLEQAVTSTTPGTAAHLRAVRDRAVILLAWTGAFRRSEIAALVVDDMTHRRQSGRAVLLVTVRRSKTDQQGEGKTKVIPSASAHPQRDPVAAVRAWTKAARITAGPLFRPVNRHGQIADHALQGQDIADIVRRTVDAAGLDPRITAHGLRAGLITAGAIAGASTTGLRAQSGHESESAFAGYVRDSGVLALDAVLKAMGE